MIPFSVFVIVLFLPAYKQLIFNDSTPFVMKKNHVASDLPPTLYPETNPMTLTDRHLHEWLDLLDHLREVHAPTAQLDYCRDQVTRLQLDLFRLRNIVD